MHVSVRHKSESHRLVHEALCEAFGLPSTNLGRDDHWSLAPFPDGPRINVLLNGSSDVPTIWVFDPNDHEDGIEKGQIESEHDLQAMIEAIRVRLARAKQLHGAPGFNEQALRRF